MEWSSSTFENIIRIENDLDRLEQRSEVNSREFSNDRERVTLCGILQKKEVGIVLHHKLKYKSAIS